MACAMPGTSRPFGRFVASMVHRLTPFRSLVLVVLRRQLPQRHTKASQDKQRREEEQRKRRRRRTTETRKHHRIDAPDQGDQSTWHQAENAPAEVQCREGTHHPEETQQHDGKGDAPTVQRGWKNIEYHCAIAIRDCQFGHSLEDETRERSSISLCS